MKRFMKPFCCLISALLISSGMQAWEVHQADSIVNAGRNIQTVGTELITTVKDANFINSLSGKVAGLIINPNAAGLGSASRITMRGPASMNGYDPVLIVIDGIPMHNASSGNMTGGIYGERTGSDGIADINPEDIEGISVISGPSAAVLYGYEAMHGAILINLKKGRRGKIELNFSNSTSFSSVIRRYEFQNSYANRESHYVSWGEKMQEPTSFTPYDFFNTGYSTINSLSISHGTEHNQTYASVSTTNTTGIIPTSGYNRYNFNLRNTLKLADDKLVIDLDARFISQDHKNLNADGLYFNPLPALYLFPRGENFQEVQMYERWNSTRNIMEQYWPTEKFSTDVNMQNPYWILNRMTNEVKKHRYMFNASLKYDITDWLNIIARVRVDNTVQDAYQKRYATTSGTFTQGSKKGFYGHGTANDKATYADVIANISKTWEDWSLHVNVGASIDDRNATSTTFNGGLKTVPNFFHYGNINKDIAKRDEAGWLRRSWSAYATVGASWKDMIFVNVAGRNDWATFLEDAEYGSVFYPSAGLSFVASELFDAPKALPYLKVRASWSEVGSAPSVGLTTEVLKYNEQTDGYAYPTTRYNDNLKPEKTRSWELGLNAKFVEGRINFDFTWYKSNTFNQTFYIPISGTSVYGNYPVQTGNVQNAGVEIALGYSDSYANDKVHFSTNFTFTHNQNKTVKLVDDAMENGYLSKGTLGISGGPSVLLTEGGTMGDLYTNQALRETSNGYIWQDENGKVRIDILDEWMHLGSTLPKLHTGWNTSLSYAGINLFVQFSGRFGGVAVSDTRAIMDRYGVSQETADARDNGGVPLGHGIMTDPHNYYDTISQIPGTYYVYDATNIRLSELSLSYDLPKKWFRNRVGLTIGLTGRNLCMIYCKAPFDPEMTAAPRSNFYQGLDCFMTPATRSLGFNIRLRFQ